MINLDKPVGPSSARLVARVKKLLPPKTKIGHAGTLDPFASGVLLLLIGKATRLSESLMDQPKSYQTTIKFGATTETDDPESPEIVRADAAPPPLAAIEAALAEMTGTVMQRPPAYSAMKIGGRRAYKLARAGKKVELVPRPVRIDGIRILKYEWPFLEISVDCGRGTYIRAIARDLGEKLGVGGYLTALRRTRVGGFTAEKAVLVETLEKETVGVHLVSPQLITIESFTAGMTEWTSKNLPPGHVVHDSRESIYEDRGL